MEDYGDRAVLEADRVEGGGDRAGPEADCVESEGQADVVVGDDPWAPGVLDVASWVQDQMRLNQTRIGPNADRGAGSGVEFAGRGAGGG